MTAARASTAPLTPPVSLLLDVTRFVLAVTVAVGHLTEINPTLPDLMPISHGAGPLFFVLSGFLIRFVTKMREHTLRDFMLDRFSRMYSVVLPAIVFTLLCDAAASHANRTVYLQIAGNYLHWGIVRVLLNATFLSAAWGLDTHMLSNAPFWTLSYEVPYYCLFGFLLFLRGWKRVLSIAALALLVGPQVLSLLPLWLLGVLLYDVYQRIRFQQRSRWMAGLLAAGVFVATLKVWPWLAHQRNPLLAVVHQPEVRAEMWRYAVVLPFTLLLFCAILLVDRIPLQARSRGLRTCRLIANGTFVVYLFHYPMLLLGRTLGLSRTPMASALLFVATIVLLTMAAPLTDRLKVMLRRDLPQMVAQARAMKAGSARRAPVPGAAPLLTAVPHMAETETG